MTQTNVAVFLGSLRKGSYSRQIADALAKIAPEGLVLNIHEIGDLAFYNPDLEEDLPASWSTFRDKVRAADAVLFITPEYNRSVPAVLKNALDVGSRPYGKSVWGGKPGAVISHSIGAVAGFGANHHLRQSLAFLDIPTLQQPEAYIGNVGSLFEQDGTLTNEDTQKFLSTFLEKFAAWIAIVKN